MEENTSPNEKGYKPTGKTFQIHSMEELFEVVTKENLPYIMGDLFQLLCVLTEFREKHPEHNDVESIAFKWIDDGKTQVLPIEWIYTVEKPIGDKSDSQETPESKLRNQLGPIYGLASMVLMLREKPEMEAIIMEAAQQAMENAKIIKPLLEEIENKKASESDIFNIIDLFRIKLNAKKNPSNWLLLNDFVANGLAKEIADNLYNPAKKNKDNSNPEDMGIIY